MAAPRVRTACRAERQLQDLLALARQQLGLGETKGRNRFPQKGTCLAIYSRAVNSQLSLDSLLLNVFSWCAEHGPDLKRLFDAYVAEKQRQAVLDFDDLLLYWAEIMREPTLARHVGARFDHVLVDEYQDTSRLQEAILLGLKPTGHASRSSATMRKASTASAQQRCTTSWSSRVALSHLRAL